MAAVVMSPPQVSSMVSAMPRETHKSRICRARNLQVNHVHGLVGVAARDHGQAVNHFIEDEWAVCVAAHSEAFFVGLARLLDVDVHVADGRGNAQSFVLRPPGVRVGDQHIAGLELCGHVADAFHVRIGIAADFQLKFVIALAEIAR